MSRVIFCTIALLLVSQAAFAAQPDCMNTATTQLAMNECAGKKLQQSDQKLNAAYRALLDKVSKQGGEQLRKTQRAWLAWRDAQCAFETMGTRDGSVNPMVHAMCIDELTQQQAKRLDAQLHCKEGDLSCGGQ
jgi:uncharacterized protein YecT (DUF1311 family)